jgi:hypothetical protein
MAMVSSEGPIKAMLFFSAQRGEAGTLGQKAVTRMDGLGLCDLRGADDVPGSEITLGRCSAADTDALIRQRRVKRILVSLGIDGAC